MRIPPLYRNSSWQRLFAGMAVGGCISWVVFLFMFGVMQERNSIIIKEQTIQIRELQSDIKIWQSDYKELNKENEEMLTIQKVTVELTNFDKYDIKDSQSIHTVQDAIQSDLRSLLAKDLATVYKNKEMIEKTIENKIVKINGKKYELVMREIHYYTTIHIEVELRLAG